MRSYTELNRTAFTRLRPAQTTDYRPRMKPWITFGPRFCMFSNINFALQCQNQIIYVNKKVPKNTAPSTIIGTPGKDE